MNTRVPRDDIRLAEVVPLIDNRILLRRENGSTDLIGDAKKVQTPDDHIVDLILCKVSREKAFAMFNTIFGILIGILFFLKAYLDDGKLSWYGLWLRLGYFLLMILDIHIVNQNPNVDNRTRWAYSVPHISGILLTLFQIISTKKMTVLNSTKLYSIICHNMPNYEI